MTRTVCEISAVEAVEGACPVHGGDNCLIVELLDDDESIGKCEWCGGDVYESEGTTVKLRGLFWHKGCADRNLELLTEAING